MHKSWVTICFILFMFYAFITQKGPQEPKAISPQEQKETHAFINKIKEYATIVTDDPKGLRDKDEPLIKDNLTSINNSQESITETTPVTNTEMSAPPSKESDTKEIIKPAIKQPKPPQTAFVKPMPMKPEDEDLGDVQNKLSNVLNNLLHTKPGKELVSRFLTSPTLDETGKKMEPNPYQNNSILTVTEGDGENTIECGDIVTMHYATRLISGQEIENTRKTKSPATFQVGEGKVIKGLEYASIGMKEGGIRRLITLPSLAYTDKKFSQGLVSESEFVTIDIEVIKIKPALPNWKDKMTIFQNAEENTGNFMLCSNPVYFTYKILTVDKEKILDKSSKQVHFTLGSRQVPAAINKAFLGIKSRSKRIVMLPSSLLYNKKISFLSPKVKLPAKGMLLFEINTGFSQEEKNKL
jgi:FKBP-type peptidyl-prolyl cis-trans isomerase